MGELRYAIEQDLALHNTAAFVSGLDGGTHVMQEEELGITVTAHQNDEYHVNAISEAYRNWIAKAPLRYVDANDAVAQYYGFGTAIHEAITTKQEVKL